MVFWPSIAENLLRNRLYQLPAYKRNAAAFGLEGAYIPLCVCSTGGFAVDNQIDHIEIHTAGDTSLLAKQYMQATQNATMHQLLFPLLEAVADFFVSRINLTNSTAGECEIKTVIGADEENGVYDNDVFTNAVAIQALETAIEVAEQLGRRVDSRWRDTARRIRIPFFEDGNPSSASAGGGALHREFDSYRGNRIGQGDTVRPVCDALLRSLSARSEI